MLLNKLKYRSWHRGTKEADILLGKFFDSHYRKMSKEQLVEYKEFLEVVKDNDIILIAQGKKKWPNNYPKSIVRLFNKYINSGNS